jgi:hypothetical protein
MASIIAAVRAAQHVSVKIHDGPSIRAFARLSPYSG